MDEKKSTATKDIEWERRILCSDESCIGVIGPDGRCKECGLAFEGTLPDGPSLEAEDSEAPASDQNDDIQDDIQSEEEDDDEEKDKAGTDDPEWEQRQLCSDEGCIGVIGPDGRCKECGKPHGS